MMLRKIKAYTISEMKDEVIGKIATPAIDQY
ncbi:hypothetical protein BSF41_38990 [Flavobacterium sp. ACN2]|nr:hypothetical protein BSF41_38990 [Flavobacterium sp. ACN2]